jgi:hypothetical protein
MPTKKDIAKKPKPLPQPPILGARVDAATKKQFEERAKRKGVKPSVLLRVLIEGELATPKAQKTIADPVPAVLANPDDATSQRIEVRLPRFLIRPLKARAKTQGMTGARWVAALAQSRLMRDPVVTDAELYSLETSNRELAAIGRNLNQVAKALNKSFNETDRLKLKTLELIMTLINENSKKIDRLIIAREKAWGVE